MSHDFRELQELVLINSYTKNKKGVDQVGNLLCEKLTALGYTPIRHKREDIGDHLFFQSPYKNGKKLLLHGHMDTVFPPGNFELFQEDEDWIYGPGVCDMKGGLMVMIEALRRQNEIFNIDILLVSDEETGSDDSRLLTYNTARNYDYCLVYEAAGNNGEVVTARKGIGTFTIEIKGKAAHAGNCYIQGIDANQEAAHKILALSHLSDLNEGTTVNVGKIEGGIGANTISPYAFVTFETRFTSSKERDRVLEQIHEIVNTAYIPGTTSALRGGLQRDVWEESNKQLQFLEDIESWSQKKIKKEHRGGGSDANIAASAGSIVLDGLGPYGDGDHTIHERANKQSFIERVELSTKIFAGFMKEIC
ncbi:M20 family metallopeptidase [Nitratiruptor sp. SB155-2]|uniref:M20 family metallopeptidase n=1 Tax=Nitratiruptor sp. (strain SB155-2) TaxID=387092 RepID=UPI00015870A4|nr:M20 family metallopeptidase [Nitratiruptor sp. SB155-2]BAF70002.1 carboxypeptidase G2 [Nitratiruptor sp. SB155-2]